MDQSAEVSTDSSPRGVGKSHEGRRGAGVSQRYPLRRAMPEGPQFPAMLRNEFCVERLCPGDRAAPERGSGNVPATGGPRSIPGTARAATAGR